VKIPGSSVPYQEGNLHRSEPVAVSPNKVKAAVSGLHPAKTAAAQSFKSISPLLSSLGLPADRLSAALVSFFRFFSLPLEPSLLAKTRRQALQAGSPGASADTPQEAAALAATAAADKGVELDPAGLGRYAAAIDPEPQPERDNETGGGASGNMQGQGEGGRNGGSQNKDKRRRPDPENAAAIAADPSMLKKKIIEAGAENPLLNLLNRLPGRNGQRWMVFPFSFTEQGLPYRASLRILLHEDPAGNGQGRADHMALDIVQGAAPGKTARRWLFGMNTANGKNPRLQVYLRPPLRKGTLVSLGRNLAALLEIPGECVSVQNYAQHCADFFPFTENGEANMLRSVDEEA
jgi:hypothetical protein